MREELKGVAAQLVALCEAYIARFPAAEMEPVDLGKALSSAPELLQERERRPERKAIRDFLESLASDDLYDLAFEMYRGRSDADPEDELRSRLHARTDQELVAVLLEKTRALPRYLGQRL